jgi:nicotinamide mononucleotide transporter
LGAAGTLLWGHLMGRFTHAALPYPDAFTTVSSLIAQWLMARKRLDSWYFWIAVDVVAVGIYLYKGLYLTTGLYAIFLGLAVTGLMVWRRHIRPLGTDPSPLATDRLSPP